MATPRTMRAVQYDKYGGGAEGLKHVEVPVPSPNKGEVLLKMEAASINPIDWKIQKGMLRPFLPGKFPHTPVGDLAGEVVELGSGVTSFKPGDKVISISFPSGGGLAEYAVAPAALTVARPPEVSAVEGACLPAAASSALQLLKATGVSFDEKTSNATGPKNVLVTAASGGVGHYAVQLSKLAGLHVTATCGARNLDFVRGLGADEVLDYKTPDGAALRSPSGRRYDAVANCAAGVAWPTLKAALADEGDPRHAHDAASEGDVRHAHDAASEGDVRQEEAGAADADAEEGGDGVAGGPGETGEAQDGGGLDVPAGQSAGGLG